MSNPNNLPTQPPAIGGWFWNEKTVRPNFLMPPYPGVDDCVQVNGRWGYRELVERDKAAQENETSENENIRGE